MCCVVCRRKVVSISRPTDPSGRDERGGGRSNTTVVVTYSQAHTHIYSGLNLLVVYVLGEERHGLHGRDDEERAAVRPPQVEGLFVW